MEIYLLKTQVILLERSQPLLNMENIFTKSEQAKKVYLFPQVKNHCTETIMKAYFLWSADMSVSL